MSNSTSNNLFKKLLLIALLFIYCLFIYLFIFSQGQYTAEKELDDPEIKNAIGETCGNFYLYCVSKQFIIKLEQDIKIKPERISFSFNSPYIDRDSQHCAEYN